MSELPRLTLDRMLEKTADELRQLPSVELVDADSKFIGFLIVPSPSGGMTIWDEIYNHAESLGVRSNIVVPPSVIEALNKTITSKPDDKFPNLVKARAVRQANITKKREMARV